MYTQNILILKACQSENQQDSIICLLDILYYWVIKQSNNKKIEILVLLLPSKLRIFCATNQKLVSEHQHLFFSYTFTNSYTLKNTLEFEKIMYFYQLLIFFKMNHKN